MLNTYSTKYGKITCYNNDIVFSSLLQNGEIYEESLIVEYIIPLLQKISDKEMTILDIGGHIGTHTILYSKLLNCKVLTFEPQQKIYEILTKNVEDNQLDYIDIREGAYNSFKITLVDQDFNIMNILDDNNVILMSLNVPEDEVTTQNKTLK